MADLLVGSVAVEKGIEYAGIFPYANAIRVFDKTKISVNRTPYLGTVNNELIRVHPNYSYDFENDSIIGLYSTVNDKLERVEENTDTRTLHLTTTATKEIVVLSHNVGVIPARKSTVEGSVFLENTTKHSVRIFVAITVKEQGGATETVGSITVTMLKKSKKVVGVKGYPTSDIKPGTDVSLVVSAPTAGIIVNGGAIASLVKLIETI